MHGGNMKLFIGSYELPTSWALSQ